MPKITYFLRSNNDRNNTHVLYCRVSFNGTKAEFSTKEKLSPKDWNQEFQKYIGKSKVRANFLSTYMELTSSNIKTAALLTDATTAAELLKPKTKPQKQSIIAILENYVQEQRKIRSPGTIRNHLVKVENFKAFQKYKKTIYTADSFSMNDAKDFIDWFTQRAQTLNIETANRNVLFFKSAMMDLVQKGRLETFGIFLFSGNKDKPKPTVFLTKEELISLQKTDFKNKMLVQVKDLFLFQCYTGLSYADIWSNWELKEQNGSWIITGFRQKNNEAFFVPVEKCVPSIIEKYNFQLPQYCNAVYNRILKEIAILANIEKTISTHTARKTFATLMDADGWTREAVAAMLGHSSTKTTERYYIGKSFARIIEEMKKRNA